MSPNRRTPFTADTEPGVRSMLRAIEREPATACVPPWPWRLIAPILRVAPIRLLARLR